MPFQPQPFGFPTEVGMFHALEVDAISFEEGAVRLYALAAYVENVDLPLRAFKRIAHEDMEERFEAEREPSGEGWFDLEPDYAKRKTHDVGFEHPILVHGKSKASEDLKEKALDSERWVIAGDTLFYNTEGLPEYWRVHQEGSSDFGARFHPSVHHPKKHVGKEGTSDQNIPARPFIGLSEEAEEKMVALLEVWFSHGVELATKKFGVGSSGILHHRVGGRFGPKVKF